MSVIRQCKMYFLCQQGLLTRPHLCNQNRLSFSFLDLEDVPVMLSATSLRALLCTDISTKLYSPRHYHVLPSPLGSGQEGGRSRRWWPSLQRVLVDFYGGACMLMRKDDWMAVTVLKVVYLPFCFRIVSTLNCLFRYVALKKEVLSNNPFKTSSTFGKALSFPRFHLSPTCPVASDACFHPFLSTGSPLCSFL